MNKIWILIVGILIASPANADWWQAMKAYDAQNYNVAKDQFSKLLTVGNEGAAFNLGAIYFNGEGVATDLPVALAYFMLASELGHEDSASIVNKIQQQSDAVQLAKADQQLALLKQTVRVWPEAISDKSAKIDSPKPLKRSEPRYPVAAARAGQFGYVTMRFLVDEQGKVKAIDVVDAYPEKTFNRDAMRAVKRWQYEATGEKHLLNVRLDFSLDGGVQINQVNEIIENNQLWQAALLDSPQHQFLLGSLLQLIDIQSGNALLIDKDLPISSKLDLSVFRPIGPATADFNGFFGRAVVRVAEDGTIIEQLEAEFSPQSELDSLIGLKLKGKIETDVYRIVNREDHKSRTPWVEPSFAVPASLSSYFWWHKAAKNGNRNAQRIMAAYDKRWEQYLLEQQDGEVMAWVGSRLLLEGQRKEGLELLDSAIAKQYELAIELKKQLL